MAVKPIIGFIGQGFIGKNYADDFERRKFKVIRYDIASYRHNHEALKSCRIIFVAVPTPTTPKGFLDNILINAVSENTVNGQLVVVKSTIVPGTTEKLQKLFPKRYFFHSPEFLTEKNATHDASHPVRNVVGYTNLSKKFAPLVMSILPKCPYNAVIPAKDAELLKYMSNLMLVSKLLTANLFYDVASAYGVDYDTMVRLLLADPRFGSTHFRVAHTSIPGSKKIGRGAGGHCFIKDLAAFRGFYNRIKIPSKRTLGIKATGLRLIQAFESYNISLLKNTKKDIDLLRGVYGNKV